ncbi:hypothetical protein [Acinetobacter sp. BSP-28]|uniref:hypothetical protein n=1 Tax=Acinetobacter sp. BSP-28 TaxID=3344661 RepID=UPI00376F77D0
MIYERDLVFALFQIAITYFFNEVFSQTIFFIVLMTVITFFSYKTGKKIYLLFIFIIILNFAYAIYTYQKISPNIHLNSHALKLGEYTIQKWNHGAGHNSVRYGLNLLNNNEILHLNCSLLEQYCPFYNDIGAKIEIKYLKINNENYSYYMKYGSQIYDKSYFYNKYKYEKTKQILFISFYLTFNLFFIAFFLWRKTRDLKTSKPV